MKKTVEQIKNDLLNKKMSFFELDNYMSINGYYSVFDDGITDCIKNDEDVIYTALDTCSLEIQIFFNILIDNNENEAQENFIMKIIKVEKF